MLKEPQYCEGHFQFQGCFYPLESVAKNTFNIEVHTTFEFRKTLIVTAEADDKVVRQQSQDLQGLSGFVAFDLETPFDWSDLCGHRRQEMVPADIDVSICTEAFHFPERQSLEILERDGHNYQMKLAWQIDQEIATAFGWFSFSHIIIYADDKTFGEQRRKLITKFGDEIPEELLAKLDSEIIQSTWEILCDLSPNARSQYADPTLMPGNYCVFRLNDDA